MHSAEEIIKWMLISMNYKLLIKTEKVANLGKESDIL